VTVPAITDALSPADLLLRSGGELAALAVELRTVERMILPLLAALPSGPDRQPDARLHLQRIDQLLQRMDALSDVLCHAAASASVQPDLRLSQRVADLRLAVLRDRLFARTAPAAADQIDLF
jgi:hypothetical protein